MFQSLRSTCPTSIRTGLCASPWNASRLKSRPNITVCYGHLPQHSEISFHTQKQGFWTDRWKELISACEQHSNWLFDSGPRNSQVIVMHHRSIFTSLSSTSPAGLSPSANAIKRCEGRSCVKSFKMKCAMDGCLLLHISNPSANLAKNAARLPRMALKSRFQAASSRTKPTTFQTTSRIFVVLGGKVTCGVRLHHPEHVVVAEQEQQPCALQTCDVRNPVQKHWVFGGDGTQLCFHELSVSQRRPQRIHSLLVNGECVIASPHDCCGVQTPGNFSQKMAIGKFKSTSVPDLCFPQMNFNAGMSPQLELKQVENGHCLIRAKNTAQTLSKKAQNRFHLEKTGSAQL